MIKVSVITVVYNGLELLPGTMESVWAQTYPHIEYIIIDGNSTDGTRELIEQHSVKINHWVSEPDRGLYDAMNKGIQAATGDFLWFVNAGDRIFAPDTLEKVVQACTPETDVLYGEVMLVNDDRSHLGTRSELTTQKPPQNLTWRSLKYGMCVCHQGFLPRREIAPAYALDNLSADIEWVIRCLQKARKTTRTDQILAEYLTGGLSKQRHRAGLTGRYKILQKYYGFLPNLLHHAVILLRAVWHKLRRAGQENY